MLRRKARKVKRVDGQMKTLLADMVETMRESKGVGLAAPQVGRDLRAVVVEYPEDDEQEDRSASTVSAAQSRDSQAARGTRRPGRMLELTRLLADVKRAEHILSAAWMPRGKRSASRLTDGWPAFFNTKSITRAVC